MLLTPVANGKKSYRSVFFFKFSLRFKQSDIVPIICLRAVDTGGKLTTGAIDTGGKLTTGAIDTGGKFTAGAIDTGGKFAAGVVGTGNAP